MGHGKTAFSGKEMCPLVTSDLHYFIRGFVDVLFCKRYENGTLRDMREKIRQRLKTSTNLHFTSAAQPQFRADRIGEMHL